jgi:hypothetical protein
VTGDAIVSIRIRIVNGVSIALCAARSIEQQGDIYLDDAAHHALTEKFSEDFTSEGFGDIPHDPTTAALRAIEESNNPNRTWWDRIYG